MTASPETETRTDPEISFLSHFVELRKRLIRSVVVLLVAFVALANFSEVLMAFIEAPVLKYVKKLQYDTMTDPLVTHLTISFYAALFVAMPYIFFEIWLFIRPALYKRERNLGLVFLLFAYPLFIGGASFCYWVMFPLAFDFFLHFDPTLEASLRVGDYLSFTAHMMMVFGLVFEMPLVVYFLARLGLVTAVFLSRIRRYAIVFIFIAAAILTPSTDVLSQMLLAGPLLVLYEVSIIVARFAGNPKPRTEPD